MAKVRAVKSLVDLFTGKNPKPADLIPHIRTHGEGKVGVSLNKAGVKGAGRKIKAAKGRMAKEDAAEKASEKANKIKEARKPVVTPTGTKRARKAPKKEPSKTAKRKEAITGAKKRPQDAMTTVVGAGVKSASKKPAKGSKNFRSALKKARKESESREPSAEFEARLNREARQGGVENLGQKGPVINQPLKDTGYTREQASDLQKGRGQTKQEILDKEAQSIVKKAGMKDGSDVSGRKIREDSAAARKAKTEALKKKREAAKKKSTKSTGGRVVRRKGGGGIAQRGLGKAFLRSRKR